MDVTSGTFRVSLYRFFEYVIPRLIYLIFQFGAIDITAEALKVFKGCNLCKAPINQGVP